MVPLTIELKSYLGDGKTIHAVEPSQVKESEIIGVMALGEDTACMN